MKNAHLRHLIELSLATVFISTSGALGKFIDMPAPVIIWWRCSLGILFLYMYMRFKKLSLKVNNKKDLSTIIISAMLTGIHWITYFYALKFSNVAIGMLSLFVFPVIIALLEPFFGKVKFDPIHIVLGVMVLIGIYILVPDFNFESTQVKGVFFGLFSAVCYALRILISKQLVGSYRETMIMFYQLLILTIVLSPVLLFMDATGIKSQFQYVIILALLTTAIGHTLFVRSLKHFTATTTSIISSAQPVFGIIIAYVFLNEIPTWNTYLGGSLILATVLIESLRSSKGIAT
jgi:drug/metabolite transporter (DMT)-like permease